MVVDSTFWRGKRVLVTGHTGFKGSWMSLWLQSMGAHVFGYALKPPTQPSLFDVARVAEGMESIDGDIRDLPRLGRVISESRPQVIIHMAAQSLVRESYGTPVDTYSTNVMGTVNVFEAARSLSDVKVVINVTSDKCYENREWVWGYRENEPMGGYDPYSSSKGCAELITAAYRNSYFNPATYGSHGVAVASVRAGNVIGGGDWAKDRLIPDTVRAFMERRPVHIRNPAATRPWQHALEPLRGYLMLAQRLWVEGPSFSEGWNFGPMDEDAKPVGWIVEQLVKRWRDGASWVVDSGDHPHEAHYLKLDCSKARTRLGWYPLYDLEAALAQTVVWYKAFQAGEDMRQLTLTQIAEYDAR